MTAENSRRVRVAVVGAGAAGTLTAAWLLRTARGRGLRCEVLLIDPAGSTGRGIAYATTDPRHLLNVPAGRMSADPGDPDGFTRWLAGHRGGAATGAEFAARWDYGSYLGDFLADSAGRDSGALNRIRERVESVRVRDGRVGIRLGSGRTEEVGAAVLALGVFAPDPAPITGELGSGGVVVGDPWLPGALAAVPDEADVLLVGTGLTMIDVALTLDRPGRVVHAVSRHGLLPRVHAARPVPALPVPSLPATSGITELRAVVCRELVSATRSTGDWRSVVDSLRPATQALWQALPMADRARFLAEDRRWWEVRRHRMPTATARRLAVLRRAGRVRLHRGEVRTGLPISAVVNCTGPRDDPRGVPDPLVRRLLTSGLATPGPLGLGFDTAADGRLVAADGRSANPLWTLGSLRRGNLWETTAIPEIRAQAVAIAEAVLGSACRAVRRPAPQRDRYGLVLSATGEAADRYRAGMDRLLRVERGAAGELTAAIAADPGFAVAHASLALLPECPDPRASIEAAVAGRGDEREREFVAAAAELVVGERPGRLLRHIRRYPLDAFAVSAAIPTIAAGGVTAGRDTWELVEGLAPAYGEDWWYLSQLAFVRQDQERWAEADELSARALAAEPASGHAVHARAHVFYETGRHEAGLSWLDGWIDGHGQSADHRTHFSWHAALHELMLGDTVAVRRRYAGQLAPPAVSGARALVDSASLLWRCRMTGCGLEPSSIGAVLEVVPPGWLADPPTPFAALHSALALAAAEDTTGLTRLAEHARRHSGRVFREAVAPLCTALLAVTEQRWADAVRELSGRDLTALGGSAAQREVIEETLLHAAIRAGRTEHAARLLGARLERRPSRLDRRRLSRLA